MDENEKWENLGLSNDFIFAKVMQDSEICKRTLELILGVVIERIEYIEEQRSEKIALDSKGVRLDVYVKDGQGTVYNCEMQAWNRGNLPKRARYYRSSITVADLEPGELYSKLNQSFVIFICTFDVFGYGLHRYKFQNRCEEVPDLLLEDGETTIFLNTEGLGDDIPAELQAFLDYVAGRDSDDDFVQTLRDRVTRVKQSAKEKVEYMTYYSKLNEERAYAKEEGREEGRESERIQAINRMLEKGYSTEQILDLGYAAEEIEQAKKEELPV